MKKKQPLLNKPSYFILLILAILANTISYAAVTPSTRSYSSKDKNTSSVVSSLAKEKNKLIFAIDLIRHGDRTPRFDFPTTPCSWSEKLGQLTPLGMRQEYELGKKLRTRYVDQYKLLSASYEPGTVYVYSTAFDRTIMSAQSLLLGLYPLGTGPRINNRPALPEAFQPIPIYSSPVDQEKLLITDNELNNFTDLLKNNMYQEEEWKKMVADITPHLAAWSRATGITLTNTYQLRSVADVLSLHEEYHMPLPKGLSPEDAKKIMQVADWQFTSAFKNKTIATATGSLLLQKFADYFKEASQQKTPLKYVLFSGHDSSIMAAVAALGAPVDKVPPYASDLNISLFDQGNNHYRVVITYNDKPIILPCTGTNSCSLEEFFALIKYSH